MNNNKNINTENTEVIEKKENKNSVFKNIDTHSITLCTSLAFLTSLLTCLLAFYVMLSSL